MRLVDLKNKLRVALAQLDQETKEQFKWVAQDRDNKWFLFEHEPVKNPDGTWDVDYNVHPSDVDLHQDFAFQYCSTPWTKMKFKLTDLIDIGTPSDETIAEVISKIIDVTTVRWIAMDRDGWWYYYNECDGIPKKRSDSWSNGNSFRLVPSRELITPYHNPWNMSRVDIKAWSDEMLNRKPKPIQQKNDVEVDGISKAITLIEEIKAAKIYAHQKELDDFDLALDSLRKLRKQ